MLRLQLALACAVPGWALAATAASCPATDHVLTGMGIGSGGTVTALANVTSQAACCALCHGNYHDECHGWVWGTSGVGGDAMMAKHNCAIMATNGKPVPVAGHTSGITRNAVRHCLCLAF